MSAPGGLWASHFGFTRTPFSKSVPADRLFERGAHQEAVARIQYCIAESALGMITGDVGAGKSVAVRAAVAGLDRTRYTIVYVANPSGGCRGLYVAITTALGATPRFHKAEAIAQVANLLAAEEAERHRKVVFLIDEAHLLSPEQLEELRLLSNAEMDSASPFAGLLVGQPTLAARLRQGGLRGTRPAHQRPLQPRRDGPRRVGRLPAPPPRARGTKRSALRRRRGRTAAPLRERHPPCAQQRRHGCAHGRRLRRQGDRRRRLREESGGGTDAGLIDGLYSLRTAKRRSVAPVIGRRSFASSCRSAETSLPNPAKVASSNSAGNSG